MDLENSNSLPSSLSTLCNSLEHTVNPQKVFVGFDGFVDEIIHVVDIRYQSDSYKRIPTIQAYADRIARGSGMSTNIELVSQQVKMGGNGPILANALLNYEVDVTYMGAIGYPEPDPVFHGLTRCRKLIGLAPPAATDALEFNDGKIIASKLSALNSITWETILNRCSLTELIRIFEDCSHLVFSNWSMIVGMNQIFREFLKQVAPNISAAEKSAFFDLADPEKRTQEDLQTALSYIMKFTEAGFRVTLSMNLKEACEICEVLGKEIPDYRCADTRELLEYLSTCLPLFCTVIHLVDRACCLHDNEYCEVMGPYCREPKLTTGAGDNFNAGFLYGLIRDLSFTDCLCLGCASSGFYVRHAKSPGLQELKDFLVLWFGHALEHPEIKI
ncbi:carbohydrate kinase family protein [Anoxybacterium hadale]|uniref:Carbohydrate kinase family protein n=1 Tax=Anoxybacterium hadale TaxID=3408580 RepID=A0ACD1A724_9FIRM|nr:carbohydrate kinase family protein [Clostridiales bacterium]